MAILIEALTDNRNRTAADLRGAFSKCGGNLGETGCVSWMFDQKGVCVVSGVEDEDQLLEASLEGGAEFYEMTEDDILRSDVCAIWIKAFLKYERTK